MHLGHWELEVWQDILWILSNNSYLSNTILYQINLCSVRLLCQVLGLMPGRQREPDGQPTLYRSFAYTTYYAVTTWFNSLGGASLQKHDQEGQW